MKWLLVGALLLLPVASHANTHLLPTAYHVWGALGDLPQIGDYDGDGKVDPTLYRPSTGHWFVLLSSAGFTEYLDVPWGTTGDVPTAGDYFGAGHPQLAVFRPSTGEWFVYEGAIQRMP